MEQEKNLESSLEKVICEEWRPIKGYEQLYEVSNFGNVRSKGRIFYQRHYSGIMAKHYMPPRIMKQNKRGNYLRIGLRNENGTAKTYSVHRLVAEAFIDHPAEKKYINHLDANPLNNHVGNLEWCTQSHNIQYAYDNGTKKPPHMRRIGQYDMDGNFIKEWESEAQIERELKVYQSNVYKVCAGKRNHAGGYKWKYIQ